jgi:DNA-directed RNA polymerase subunit RPC12/RpoP
MIGTSFPRHRRLGAAATDREEHPMSTVTSTNFVGAGSFRCRGCGYTLTLSSSDELTACPSCGGEDFVRASLFSTERMSTRMGLTRPGARLFEPISSDRDSELVRARAQIAQPGEYLCYEEGGELRTIALNREWTRIGRSLAADVRLDDPTVSRRHALIVRQPDGVRLLDDRSLNGVFVNGERVDGQALEDADEIIVGRYRLSYLSIPPEGSERPAAAEPPPLHSDG